MSLSTKSYRFDLQQGQVTGVYEVTRGRLHKEKMDAGDQWQVDGQEVTRTHFSRGEVETTVYADNDGDGLFTKSFELEVLASGSRARQEDHRFSLADGTLATGSSLTDADLLASMQELSRRGWKSERLDIDDAMDAVTVDGEVYIVHAETQRGGGLEFSIYRDGDGDGLWTEIAEGETTGAYVTADGQVDLVGIAQAGLLAPADFIIG